MKIQNDKFYMIRHIPTGLYKTGGNNANFNKTGKIWRGANIKNHLRLFDENYKRSRYSHWNSERDSPLTEKIDETWKNGTFSIDECEIIEIDFKINDRQSVREFVETEMEDNHG